MTIMAYQYKFERVMSIKESEKDRLMTEYNEAVQSFEKVGQQLYEYLKQKEQLIDEHAVKMRMGLSITDVKQFQLFIDHLEKMIAVYQQKVMSARQTMQLTELKLRDKNMEVKKFEKMKVKDFRRYKETQKELESKQMDEVSIQQYMLKGN
ncbi:flagellar export protein FliJ [Priestia abyssalis]|uniref:flagellar export protein FliJ n=1 Tax=Priestia abyssalis TaxID=1221450 RepID=UPI001116271F|nr:flagellar export protein FliJ [Priestia abyssalis]